MLNPILLLLSVVHLRLTHTEERAVLEVVTPSKVDPYQIISVTPHVNKLSKRHLLDLINKSGIYHYFLKDFNNYLDANINKNNKGLLSEAADITKVLGSNGNLYFKDVDEDPLNDEYYCSSKGINDNSKLKVWTNLNFVNSKASNRRGPTYEFPLYNKLNGYRSNNGEIPTRNKSLFSFQDQNLKGSNYLSNAIYPSNTKRQEMEKGSKMNNFLQFITSFGNLFNNGEPNQENVVKYSSQVSPNQMTSSSNLNFDPISYSNLDSGNTYLFKSSDPKFGLFENKQLKGKSIFENSYPPRSEHFNSINYNYNGVPSSGTRNENSFVSNNYPQNPVIVNKSNYPRPILKSSLRPSIVPNVNENSYKLNEESDQQQNRMFQNVILPKNNLQSLNSVSHDSSSMRPYSFNDSLNSQNFDFNNKDTNKSFQPLESETVKNNIEVNSPILGSTLNSNLDNFVKSEDRNLALKSLNPVNKLSRTNVTRKFRSKQLYQNQTNLNSIQPLNESSEIRMIDEIKVNKHLNINSNKGSRHNLYDDNTLRYAMKIKPKSDISCYESKDLISDIKSCISSKNDVSEVDKSKCIDLENRKGCNAKVGKGSQGMNSVSIGQQSKHQPITIPEYEKMNSSTFFENKDSGNKFRANAEKNETVAVSTERNRKEQTAVEKHEGESWLRSCRFPVIELLSQILNYSSNNKTEEAEKAKRIQGNSGYIIIPLGNNIDMESILATNNNNVGQVNGRYAIESLKPKRDISQGLNEEVINRESPELTVASKSDDTLTKFIQNLCLAKMTANEAVEDSEQDHSDTSTKECSTIPPTNKWTVHSSERPSLTLDSL